MKNCVKFEKGGLTSLKNVSRKDFRLVKKRENDAAKLLIVSELRPRTLCGRNKAFWKNRGKPFAWIF